MDKIQKFLIIAGRKDLAQEYFEKLTSLIFVVKGKTYTLTEDFKDLKKGTEIKVKEIDGKKVTISAGKEKLEVSLKSLLESIKL